MSKIIDLLEKFAHGAVTDLKEGIEKLKEEVLDAVREPADGGVASGTGARQTWENQLANQVVHPLQTYKPALLAEIQGVLGEAVRRGLTVKAAGSGHSYSNVATTPGLFIDTHGLKRLASKNDPIAGQLGPDMLRVSTPLSLEKIDWPDYAPEQNRALVEMECGIRIRALNQELEARDLGLPNMGGYDGQTIMGVISTATHGSGITLGPFSDLVKSMVLATTGTWNGTVIGGASGSGTAGVNLYRIEPSDGITDPAKYDDANIGLIQDDDCFNAAICSMGCFGVVYSVVLEVMQLFWLSETRELTTLDTVYELLESDAADPTKLPDSLTQFRHFEVLVHPYPMEGNEVIDMDPSRPASDYYSKFKCLVTRRNIVEPPNNPSKTSGSRNFITSLMGSLEISFEVLVEVMNTWPETIPYLINQSLNGLEDDHYIARSYEVYDLGLPGDTGFATEIAFPIRTDAWDYTEAAFKAAVDRIHATAQTSRQVGDQYQTSPFALRFVAASRACLAMMEGMDTCMIELDMVTGTFAGPEVMHRYQQSMYDLGGRPHWGLEFDHLTGSNGLIAKMYPQLSTWLAVYHQFNAEGTFNNGFTERVGFSVADFQR